MPPVPGAEWLPQCSTLILCIAPRRFNTNCGCPFIGEEFYAAGWHRDWLILARGQWDGSIQIPAGEAWKVPHELHSQSIKLAADPRGLGKVCVFVSASVPDRDVEFPQGRLPTGDAWQPVAAGPHPGFSEAPLGMCYGDDSSLLVANLGDFAETIDIATYHVQQHLKATLRCHIAPEDLVELHVPLPLFARQGTTYLGVRQTLIMAAASAETIQVHSPIRHITGSAPHTRARVVLACEQGGVVIWGKSELRRETTFALDLLDPVVGLTRGGWLVAATSDAIQVYGTHDGRLSFVGEVEGPGQSPVAVLPTSDTDQFALLLPDGGVSIYQVPRR
jgi:hypothetical protein